MIGLSLIGLTGFFGAAQMDLADIRFYAFSQLMIALTGAYVIGWVVTQRCRYPQLCCTAIMLSLLPVGPPTDQIGQWARWNLEGYEQKALWRQYQNLADHSRVPLHAPRVVFVPSPLNPDLATPPV